MPGGQEEAFPVEEEFELVQELLRSIVEISAAAGPGGA